MKLYEFIEGHSDPEKGSVTKFMHEVKHFADDATVISALNNLFETTPVDRAGSLVNRVNELLRMYRIPLVVNDIDLFSRNVWYK